MKQKKLIVTSLITAVAIGASYKLYQDYDKRVKTRRAINRIKGLFDNPDEITGTWIEDTPREYQHDNFKTQAYFGGLVRKDGNQILEYSFILSAKNYALLDLKLIA